MKASTNPVYIKIEIDVLATYANGRSKVRHTFLAAFEGDKMRFAIGAPIYGFSQEKLDRFTHKTRWEITNAGNRAIVAWAYIM